MKIEEWNQEIEKLNIKFCPQQMRKLQTFYHLLLDWNQKMNLTRITDEEEVYWKHFYDSLTLNLIVDFNKVKTVCDIGSGAGFPGIVLKIAFPDLKIVLIDSLQKRVNYLNEIIRQLELTDIVAIHSRAEEYARFHREEYEVVTARAVANLKVLSELCIPLVQEQGYFIAMKANATEEIEEAKAMIGTLGGKIDQIHEFSLPMDHSKRTLIRIQKYKKTDSQFPRKKIK